jgi:hypothetical protein
VYSSAYYNKQLMCFREMFGKWLSVTIWLEVEELRLVAFVMTMAWQVATCKKDIIK